MLKHYIHPEELEVQPMLYGAVRGLVRSAGDPYSVFMNPSENTEFHQSLNGELEGIGAELTLRNDLIVVVAPLKGSPASKAGLLPEDIIVKVDGESTEGETLHETVQRIRGPRGTDVMLTVYREKEGNVEITITRQHINVPSVESELLETDDGTVAYITINQFAEDTTKETRKALETLLDDNPDGLIVDVRYNGGGYLDRAIDLVSMFLQKGKVVSVARKEGSPEAHFVYGRPINTEIPMAVLINQGSASASEILAGALQDHGRATIIGMTSFGKGTIQEIFSLPGGSSLRITVAKWLTPNGTDLGKEGVHPDIEVDRTPEDVEQELDPQLDKALEILLGTGDAISSN